MLGGGISASTSDRSHREVTYLFWYGGAGLFVLATIVLTSVIERRRIKAPRGAVVTAGLVAAPGPGETLVVTPLPDGGWVVANPAPAPGSTAPAEASGYTGEESPRPPTSGV